MCLLMSTFLPYTQTSRLLPRFAAFPHSLGINLSSIMTLPDRLSIGWRRNSDAHLTRRP